MDRTRRLAALRRERTQLGAYLHELTAEEWQAPSKAPGWSVRLTPEHVAAKVISAIRHNRARVLVGADVRISDAVARIAGSGYQRFTLLAATKFG